jgi:uncharacterized protein YheU (UPF0270 family)
MVQEKVEIAFDMIEIPHQKLESWTLEALIVDFVTRDGTDYGEREAGLEEKINQVKAKLVSGEIAIAFDPHSESCGLIKKR